MVKLAIALTLGLAAASGATIDSGIVLTFPYSTPDGTTAALINLSSSDGNFSLSSPGLLGGGNLDCVVNYPPVACAFGTYSIQASFPDASTYPAQASVTIAGSPMGTLLLGCSAPVCPDTLLRLSAQPVDILAAGDYEVPFSVSGQIQAAQSMGSPLLLDQTVSGGGVVDFSVTTVSPGRFVINPSFHGSPFGLRWDFEPIPEPSMFLPVLLGLAAIQWRRRRKQLA